MRRKDGRLWLESAWLRLSLLRYCVSVDSVVEVTPMGTVAREDFVNILFLNICKLRVRPALIPLAVQRISASKSQ